MALKDFMAKKTTKKEEEEQARIAEEKAKTNEFLKELDILQRKYDVAISAYIEYTESGISPKFRLIPYPKEDVPA